MVLIQHNSSYLTQIFIIWFLFSRPPELSSFCPSWNLINFPFGYVFFWTLIFNLFLNSKIASWFIGKYLGLEGALNIDVPILKSTWDVYFTFCIVIQASLPYATVTPHIVDIFTVAQMGTLNSAA